MKTYMPKDLFQIYMNNLALSIINCLSIWNLFMIIWKVLCSIGNCYCWLYFLYFPKLTYPMLVDISFLKFISCCTFSILWGNDDTIESAFSLYSLSNIPGKLFEFFDQQLSIVIPQLSIVISQLLIVISHLLIFYQQS